MLSSKEKFIDIYRKNTPFVDREYIKFSKELGVISIEDDVIELISYIAKINNFKNVLEVGSGIGYSTKILSKVMPEASIISLEKNEERAEYAKRYTSDCKNVEIINDDAITYLKNSKKQIDFLFLDGAKSKYLEVLDLATPLMIKGSVIIADNIFIRGKMYSEDLNRRNRTMVKKLKLFLESIFSEEFDSILIPISDGVIYAKKK